MPQENDDQRIVGVYPDEQAADRAARVAGSAGADDVRVNSSEDEISALEGEMREEAGEGHNVFYTPGMKRSVPRWTLIGVLAGVVVGLPFAFFGADGDLPLATRLLLVGLAGAATGGTIAFIVSVIVCGGFLGRLRSGTPDLAAERGVVVGADDRTGRVGPTLAGDDEAVRVDRLSPTGRPDATLASSDDEDDGEET